MLNTFKNILSNPRRMVLILTGCLLTHAGFAAKPPRIDSPDTPLNAQTLQAMIECRDNGERAGLMDLVMLSGELSWIKRNTDDSSAGMYGYTLKKPLVIFGQPYQQVVLHKDFVSVVLPKNTDIAVLAKQHRLTAIPSTRFKQYYRFINPKTGPMLSVYQLPDDPMAALLGKPASTTTNYLGCNYTQVTEQEFKKAALQADQQLKNIDKDMQKLLKLPKK